MIIGGCLIILVENQHIKGEIASRYYNIMRPFYHKLALYAKFAQQCMFALSAIDDEGKRYKKLLQDKTIDIKRLALRAVMTGKDNPYLNAKELNSICNDINGIWCLLFQERVWVFAICLKWLSLCMKIKAIFLLNVISM